MPVEQPAVPHIRRFPILDSRWPRMFWPAQAGLSLSVARLPPPTSRGARVSPVRPHCRVSSVKVPDGGRKGRRSRRLGEEDGGTRRRPIPGTPHPRARGARGERDAHPSEEVEVGEESRNEETDGQAGEGGEGRLRSAAGGPAECPGEQGPWAGVRQQPLFEAVASSNPRRARNPVAGKESRLAFARVGRSRRTIGG